MKENKDLVESMCKGCSMSVEVLNDILKKIDSNINSDIKIIKDDYNNFLLEAEDILKNKDSEIKGLNLFEKISTGIMMDLKLIEYSEKKIAELVIKGINMGLKETEKILSLNDISAEYSELANKYINMQNKSKDRLIKYIK